MLVKGATDALIVQGIDWLILLPTSTVIAEMTEPILTCFMALWQLMLQIPWRVSLVARYSNQNGVASQSRPQGIHSTTVSWKHSGRSGLGVYSVNIGSWRRWQRLECIGIIENQSPIHHVFDFLWRLQIGCIDGLISIYFLCSYIYKLCI